MGRAPGERRRGEKRYESFFSQSRVIPVIINSYMTTSY
jgi:hypothetical protein